MSEPLAWYEDHDCRASPGPCWKTPSDDSGLCVNCAQPWPRCLSEDALACMMSMGDMLDKCEYDRLEAEIARRGIDPYKPKSEQPRAAPSAAPLAGEPSKEKP